MAVYFKFRSVKEFESVSVDGLFISVASLRKKIIEKKKLQFGSDFDLQLWNADFNEIYSDVNVMIPRYSAIVVRRVPRPSLPIEVQPLPATKKMELSIDNASQLDESRQKLSLPSRSVDDVDDFGTDMYTVPKVGPVVITSSLSQSDEDVKIRTFLDSSTNTWRNKTNGNSVGEKSEHSRGFFNKFSLHGRGIENEVPHEGYVCHRCRVAGHFIQNCPTNGDSAFDRKRVRAPTSIPQMMLDPDSRGTYFLPTGEVAVIMPKEDIFDREVASISASLSVGHRHNENIPQELCCQLCKKVFQDAVLTSKCCFRSFCDSCIRVQIISKAQCVCGATKISVDDLVPNKTLREAVKRLVELTISHSTSSGNVSTITSTESAASRIPQSHIENFRATKKQKMLSVELQGH